MTKARRSKSAFETYRAKADAKIALAVANEKSPFTIEVRFLGGLTKNQKKAFKAAANRWSRVIIGDLPSVLVDGEVVDDILILAQAPTLMAPAVSWDKQARRDFVHRTPGPLLSSRLKAKCSSTR